MKWLIVNADDFGLAESVNRGIIVAHRDGILTSTSLLANGPAFQHAVASSGPLPQLSIGVHLNLSQGTPVLPASRIPSLVDDRGELHFTPFQLWRRISRRRICLDEIHAECRAQILKVLEGGVTPTHLDGHLHVHVLPELSSIVIDLAREFGIRSVRSPTEDLERTLPSLSKALGPSLAALKRSAIAYVVNSLASGFRKRMRGAGLLCPDAFVGMVHSGLLNARSLSALLSTVPEGTTELMCHPGYTSAQVESLGGELTTAREAELLALTAPETKVALRSLGIHLINFRDFEKNLSS